MPSPRVDLGMESQSLLSEMVQAQKLLLSEMKSLRADMTGHKPEEPMMSEELSTKEAAEPKRVEMSVCIRRLYDVRTKEQEFTARLSADLLWEMPAGENPPPEDEDDGDWMPNWTPKFRIRGQKSEDRTEMYSTETIGDKVFVRGEIVALVIISEGFELQQFPNDCQDLTIQLQSTMPSTQCKYVSPKDGSAAVQIRKGGCYLDDFGLLPDYPFTFNLYMVEQQNRNYSTVEIKVKVVRQASYYLLNVICIMCLICSFVLCAWAVHPGAIADRWGVDFNLILTAVAYKLIINDMLPRLSYVTTLDIYVLACFIFLSVSTASHSFVPLIFHDKFDYSALTLPPDTVEGEEEVISADITSFYVFAFGWLAWNLFYGIYFYTSRINNIKAFRDAAEKEAADIDGADDELLAGGRTSMLQTAQSTNSGMTKSETFNDS
eukprot:CAMPEP_0197668346 /NCGR_PEP_ID=MMETSP1338-20131121/69070_1 /TAXON_ID=43686 ORGANISM="Pelagodinium beii, Strain RCC1491" /NCGR_SAMPLE_ID=MMETSP1338 /ASSEMBLY_ACC=CAM_ASM_000754 /LENGTH=433 /DNA_ID=CAMNT_0043247753 /DNA_START=1 /DNA_END=1302 /DNA_ORIENTATION=+